jgi:hypothetical protein
MRQGGPLPAVSYSIAPKRPSNTVLPVLTRERARAISAENARHVAPPTATATAEAKPKIKKLRRLIPTRAINNPRHARA